MTVRKTSFTVLDHYAPALKYIESRLTSDTVNYDEAARAAGCTQPFLKQLFLYATGISLEVYVKRRKMSEAALEIAGNGNWILDTALKYGYASPTAFTRAFVSVHGVTPAAVRKHGAHFFYYGPILPGNMSVC